MKENRPLNGQRPPHVERVYVKVNSDFDATGYMQPRSITWADGRTFPIDAVKDHRPAACYRQGAEGSCYMSMKPVEQMDREKHGADCCDLA